MKTPPARPEVEAALHKRRIFRILNSDNLPAVEKGFCVWCGCALSGRRTRWCSKACVDQYLIRNDLSLAGSRVEERDHGICANCGIDTIEILALMRFCRPNVAPSHGQAGPKSAIKIQDEWGPWGTDYCTRLWQMDHILPVVEGGGCCGLDNYQTLCLPCHKRDTAVLAGKLARRREIERTGQCEMVFEGSEGMI